MEEPHIYQKIVAAIRQDILAGRLRPGERLPTVRQTAADWGCTIGTAQRAYAELADQGLVVSRSGQGTHVVDKPPIQNDTPLRRALLVHRAEAFLLETLTAGYTPVEVESALRLALDQWRAISTSPQPTEGGVLRFAGSHDLALSWLAAHFPADESSTVVPRFTLQLGFNGSLGGLIALQQGRADLAGCHLWDEATGQYNAPFVRRLLPGRRVALLTLVHRRLGLILPAGNPLNLAGLPDLARPGLHFVNRQPGSGTRVWLDAALRRLGVDTSHIQGYDYERLTHSDVARAVAEGQANAGFGLETAALTLGLDFIPLVTEPYDLVIPAENLDLPGIQRLRSWLGTDQACQALSALGGYDTTHTGELAWVE
jgi:molybdate-binding protein/DNA-binding transcriptional regulator YhcF (GntR family)